LVFSFKSIRRFPSPRERRREEQHGQAPRALGALDDHPSMSPVADGPTRKTPYGLAVGSIHP
jgi:hypothetical protein